MPQRSFWRFGVGGVGLSSTCPTAGSVKLTFEQVFCYSKVQRYPNLYFISLQCLIEMVGDRTGLLYLPATHDQREERDQQPLPVVPVTADRMMGCAGIWHHSARLSHDAVVSV
jgi:hypothetical protein